jgi:hypothetical protein
MDSRPLDAVREAKERRLAILEERAAQRGIDAPAEVVSEISDLRAQLDIIAAATNPPIDEPIRRALRRYDQIDFNISVTAGLMGRVTKIEEAIKSDKAQRIVRQWVLNTWLFLITAGVLYLILR